MKKRKYGESTQQMIPFFCMITSLQLAGKTLAIAASWSQVEKPIRRTHIKTYPDSKKGAIATSAGMLYRFAVEMKIGDYVVFPSKTDRKINIGIVESDFIYKPEAAPYVQQRNVKWLKQLPRTAFSQGALYEVGSALSFFCSRTTQMNTCRLWIKASSHQQLWQNRRNCGGYRRRYC